jgi:hypothetical protein
MSSVSRIAIGFGLVAILMLSPFPTSTKEVPLITAPDSPIKVRPVEEGGKAIPYQNIIVMNPTLSAAPGKTERLMAPPENPLPVSSLPREIN